MCTQTNQHKSRPGCCVSELGGAPLFYETRRGAAGGVGGEGEGRVSEGNDGVVVVCSSVIECLKSGGRRASSVFYAGELKCEAVVRLQAVNIAGGSRSGDAE